MRQSQTGFSLLKMDEIASLMNKKCGYMSRQHPGLARQDKNTLVLDVDETILSATPWASEICVGDLIQRIDESGVPTNDPLKIIAIAVGTSNTHKTVVMSSNDELRSFFTKHILEPVHVTSVWLSNNQTTDSFVTVTIPDLYYRFMPYLASVDDLHSYNARRDSFAPVSFFCEGYMIRLRPHLPKFLFFACTNFRVVIFTAAVRHVYEKVLEYIRLSLSPMLGDIPLWEQAFFREDCDADGKYYHKDITKLGVDLSQIVIIDDKHHSFRGFEPNAIRIAPFAGSCQDDQLLHIMAFLQTVADAVDVRYSICGITEEDVGETTLTISSSTSSLISSNTSQSSYSDSFTTTKFLHCLNVLYQKMLENEKDGDDDDNHTLHSQAHVLDEEETD